MTRFASGRISKILTGSLTALWLNLAIALIPASAEVKLGVVRSSDNTPEWESIKTRLQGIGTAYRTIDLQEMRSLQDLQGITVIFLPDISTLTLDQVQILQEWVNQGGRVFTSAAIASASTPEVQQALQTLLSSAPNAGQENPSNGLDPAWLKAVLTQEPRLSSASPPSASPSPRPAISPSPSSLPVARRPPEVQPVPSEDPAETIAPAGVEVEPGTLPINTLEAIAMRQELENLIGRVESAILAANTIANNALPFRKQDESDNVLQPTEALKGTTLVASPPRPSSDSLLQARQLIRDFSESVEQGNYATARRQWLEARQLLWNSYPLDRPFAQSEIRAVWLDRGTIVRAGSEEKLAVIFDRLAAAGINTVFLETINAGYPIYPSRVAPQQNPLTRRWDPLATAVKLAHQRRMELHAWVWVFAVGNQKHNQLLQLPASYPGPVLSAHPEWANADKQGNAIPKGQNKPFLDPANPAVRTYLLQLFTEIVTRYEVDGLHLDYIRYPFQDPAADRTYGYGTAARQQFKQLTGVDPITLSPRSSDRSAQALWQQWTDFRAQQVTSFVAEVSQKLRVQRPNLIVSAAVFPLPEFERLHKLQQHWEVWAKEGYVDLIVPMSYAADTNRFQRIVNPWLMEANLGGTLVLPGIYLNKLPELMTIDQIQAVRNLPGEGYSLFAAEHFSDLLQVIFSQTQRSPQSGPDLIPYRQPFAVAAMRFNALQREWAFLISMGKLRFRDTELADWYRQTEAVEQALNELAEKPSPERLETAVQRVEAFRSEFKDQLRLAALGLNYQVRTWDNRLAAIDRLLQYGSRSAFRSRS